MANKNFRKATRPTGAFWQHISKPHWVVKYDALKDVRPAVYYAFRAIVPVPKGRQAWTVDNRCIGSKDGFKTLAEAMKAAA